MLLEHRATQVAETLRNHAQPITSADDVPENLLDAVGDASIVLLGESSHGTHEFYRSRAAITQRLVEEKGFNAVAVEADWPDAYRVNRYIRGTGDDSTPEGALSDFKRFPLWMWRNTEILRLVESLRKHNAGLDYAQQTGFYGLDLYSLYSSIRHVIEYLDDVDPAAAHRARERYACFNHGEGDAQTYGYGVQSGLRQSCEDAAVRQLVDLRERAADELRSDGLVREDEQFFAERNAVLVQNAEEYYRSMFGRRANSWNLRDRHMADTLDALWAHLSRRAVKSRIVVWAHNSHLGDARATEMSRRGEWNLGQLARQRHEKQVFSIGYTTSEGTVSAASHWDGEVEHKSLNKPLDGSYEQVLSDAGIGDFFLRLSGSEGRDVAKSLKGPLLERYVGVIYRPDTERASHYIKSELPEQFDAIIHFNTTRALEPLEPGRIWRSGAEREDAPETYPSGL